MNIGPYSSGFPGLPSFGSSDWSLERWISELEASKNQKKGLLLAIGLPVHLLENKQIQKLVEECEATSQVLSSVSSNLWTAVERIPDEEGHGYQIVFESIFVTGISNTYNSAVANQTNEKIYPAVEPPPRSINLEYLDNNTFKKLGFDLQRTDLNKKPLLILPDTELLQARWEKLGLPKLKILKDPGILEDEEFLKAQFEYDFVCSQGKEFVHDMLVHFRPTATFISRDPKGYAKFKKEWTSFLRRGFDTLQSSKVSDQTYKQCLNLLSYAADNFSAYPDKTRGFWLPNLEGFPDFMNYGKDPAYSKYLDRTFGKDRLPKDEFIRQWREIFRETTTKETTTKEKTTKEKVVAFIKKIFKKI